MKKLFFLLIITTGFSFEVDWVIHRPAYKAYANYFKTAPSSGSSNIVLSFNETGQIISSNLYNIGIMTMFYSNSKLTLSGFSSSGTLYTSNTYHYDTNLGNISAFTFDNSSILYIGDIGSAPNKLTTICR